MFNVVNNDCQKSDLDKNMTLQCIPGMFENVRCDKNSFMLI